MTEPSDAEIDAQWRESVEKHETTAAFVRSFARAVLAKWGMPQADYDHGPQSKTVQEAARHVGKWLNERPNRPLDLRDVAMLSAHAQAQAQAQAQAGAVPLTPKQVAEIADAAHREYDRLVGSGQFEPRWSAVFAHLLERAHGIGIKNGGRHA